MDTEKQIKRLKEKNSKAMSALGKLGGQVTKMRHGPKYFSEIAKKGLEKRWGKKRKKAAKKA